MPFVDWYDEPGKSRREVEVWQRPRFLLPSFAVRYRGAGGHDRCEVKRMGMGGGVEVGEEVVGERDGDGDGEDEGEFDPRFERGRR